MYVMEIRWGRFFKNIIPFGTIDTLEEGGDKFLEFLKGVGSDGTKLLIALIFDEKGDKVRRYSGIDKEIDYKYYKN